MMVRNKRNEWNLKSLIVVIYYLLFVNVESFCITSAALKSSCRCSSTKEPTPLLKCKNTNYEEGTRRHFFRRSLSIIRSMGVAATFSPLMIDYNSVVANALDFDAFMNAELNADTSKAEISEDAKTCKYAAPGKEKGDACVRAGMSVLGKNGGVDAYGNLDRGDYVRCQTSYPMIDGKYVKTVTCQ